MSFLDDVIVTGKEALDTTVKFTGEVIEGQKLRCKAASLRSQISKEYETLGRLYFDTAKNETDNEEVMKNAVENIKKLTEQLTNLESQTDGCKVCRTCVSCGTKNPSDSVFCNKCGKKL